MTKKELKQLEEQKAMEQGKKIQLKRQFLKELKDWRSDVSATTRYYKINGIKDKLTYRDELNEEETKQLFDRYEVLSSVVDYNGNRDWAAVRTVTQSDEWYNGNDDYVKFETPLSNTTLVIDDIVWDQEQFDKTIELAKMFGYTEVLYIDSSTACMETIIRFTKAGYHIVGTNGKMTKSWGGEGYHMDKEGVVISLEC